jgi:PAS domain S-box-containing protein
MNDLWSADANIQTAMLEAISEGVSGGVLIYDKNDVIVFASQHLLNLLSVPKSFLAPGTRLRDLLGAVHDSGGRFSTDGAGSRRILNREDWIAEQIATLWKERTDALERRGTDRWLSFSRRRLPSGYGVCVIKDVSDHKKREEQWRGDMERVQITEEVLDNLPFPITVKDRNLTFVAVNKAACRFFDLPPEAVLGRKGSDIHPPELEQRLADVNRQLFETGEPVQIAQRVKRRDGTEIVIGASKYRIGKPGRYYLVTAMEDVTARVDRDGENGPVSSHVDPVDLISSSLDLLEQQLDPELKTAGEDAVSRKVLVVSADPRTEQEALLILAALQLDISSVSSAEELALFLRLAGEAGIGVDLIVVDAEMHVQCLEIATDYGIAAITINADSMVQELAAAVAHALEDKDGSSVDDENPQITFDSRAEGTDIDILVAEDNDVNQIVFSQILEGFGYRYAIAADGEEAVRLWQQHAPRLILMDVTLPKLNGFEASARIRALETIDNSVAIIGVLAFAFDKDRDQCFASGMNDVILKPISPEALEAVFEGYLGATVKRSYA